MVVLLVTVTGYDVTNVETSVTVAVFVSVVGTSSVVVIVSVRVVGTLTVVGIVVGTSMVVGTVVGTRTVVGIVVGTTVTNVVIYPVSKRPRTGLGNLHRLR